MNLKLGELAGVLTAAAAVLTLVGLGVAWIYDVKIDVAVLKRDVAEIHDVLFPKRAWKFDPGQPVNCYLTNPPTCSDDDLTLPSPVK